MRYEDEKEIESYSSSVDNVEIVVFAMFLRESDDVFSYSS